MKIDVNSIAIPDATPNIDEKQLEELTESMKEKGLSHPIIVRPANSIGFAYMLASGEKRLLAARRLEWKQIDAVVKDVSEKEGKELRLHENLKRFNLEWWDQVLLVEQLHLLRQDEHGIATRGRPSRDEPQEERGWSIRDTARELGVGVGPVSEDLNLARHLRSDPTLSKVKDKKTAIRLVRIATQRYENERDASLPTKFEANQVFFGDSTVILSNLPANSVDICITDPPWIKFFDPSLTIDERTLPVFKEVYRVLKPNSFLYLFCGLDDFVYYAGTTRPDPDLPTETIHDRGELEKLGFQVSNTPIIWRKENALSRRGVRPWEYDRDFEFIIVAAKGSPALTTSRRLSGVKAYPIVPPVKMHHPHEKPVELIDDMVTDCSYEGNIILDPFAGSGVVGESCKKLKRGYILCEREKKFYDGICKRLGIK